MARIIERRRVEIAAGLALLAAVVAGTAGCGGRTPEGAGAATPKGGPRILRFGAVLPMFSHPFFVAQKEGLERQAKDLNVAIDVRDGQDDDAKQAAQVQALLDAGVDAIILCPRDEDAAVAAVEAANLAGVPVVTMNRRVHGGNVVAYIGADDEEGGRAQGRALVEALGPKGGAILYLQGTQGSSPQRMRESGLKAVLKDHAEITIADERFAGFAEDQAKEVMTDLVRRFKPGEIAAIVAQSDEMALPAAEVARGEGWADVVVIGFNGTKEAFDAVKDGRLKATVLQDAAEQGALAMKAAAEHVHIQHHLKGQGTVNPEQITPLPVVTKANVDQLKPAY